MFERLFGATEAEQLHYLQSRVIITAAGLAVGIVSCLLSIIPVDGISAIGKVLMSVTGLIFLVAMFMWGFGAIKSLLGWGSVGAIFSGNVVIGVVIFMFCAVIAYLISIVVALLGIGRFIYLKVKVSANRG